MIKFKNNLIELLDVDYYLFTNRDIFKSRVNPLKHWIEYGIVEEREPNPFFSFQMLNEFPLLGSNKLKSYLQSSKFWKYPISNIVPIEFHRISLLSQPSRPPVFYIKNEFYSNNNVRKLLTEGLKRPQENTQNLEALRIRYILDLVDK